MRQERCSYCGALQLDGQCPRPDCLGSRAAYARRDDPDTSHAAAARVDATQLEGEVVSSLKKLGREGTSKEVSADTGRHEWSISPRFKPLERKGLIRRTDRRRNRCIVWELTEEVE